MYYWILVLLCLLSLPQVVIAIATRLIRPWEPTPLVMQYPSFISSLPSPLLLGLSPHPHSSSYMNTKNIDSRRSRALHRDALNVARQVYAPLISVLSV